MYLNLSWYASNISLCDLNNLIGNTNKSSKSTELFCFNLFWYFSYIFSTTFSKSLEAYFSYSFGSTSSFLQPLILFLIADGLYILLSKFSYFKILLIIVNVSSLSIIVKFELYPRYE